MLSALIIACIPILLIYFRTGTNPPESPELRTQKSSASFALLVVLGRNGIPVSYDRIYSTMSSAKTQKDTINQLRTIARSFDLDTSQSTIDWNVLKRMTSPLIIQFNQGTFACIDPREQDALRSSELRVYEQGREANWHTQEELLQRWSGKIITISQLFKRNTTAEPCVNWNTCFIDNGVHDLNSHYEFTYKYRNMGTKPLKLEMARLGCGCARAEIPSKLLEPGASASLKLFVDASNKRGYFLTYIDLVTNDPKRFACRLYAAGTVLQPLIASVDVLDFGNVARGSVYEKSLFIHDRGDGKTVIRDCRIEFEAASDRQISANIDLVKLGFGDRVPNQTFKYPVRPGDYMVKIKLTVHENAPFGEFKGLINLGTNMRDVLKIGPIRVVGAVTGNYYIEPAVVILSDTVPTVTVRLKNNNGMPVKVQDILVDNADASFSYNTSRDTVSGDVYYLVMLSKRPKTMGMKGKITFVLGGGENIVLPVIILGQSKNQITN